MLTSLKRVDIRERRVKSRLNKFSKGFKNSMIMANPTICLGSTQVVKEKLLRWE